MSFGALFVLEFCLISSTQLCSNSDCLPCKHAALMQVNSVCDWTHACVNQEVDAAASLLVENDKMACRPF